jgi:hypothetical protein
MQVDFNAKNEYDMINNYKIMQDVFNKLGVEKVCAEQQLTALSDSSAQPHSSRCTCRQRNGVDAGYH